jgi:hypothetical protein
MKESTKQKLSNSKKGIKLSIIHRTKIANGLKRAFEEGRRTSNLPPIPWNKGKELNKEIRNKISTTLKEYYKTHKPVNFKGKPTNIKITNNFLYKEFRKLIFKKHNYTCQLCGQIGGYIHLHHIRPKAKYPELLLVKENVTVLCKDCHRLLHKNSYLTDLHIKIRTI